MAVKLTKGDQFNIENDLNCARIILAWDKKNDVSEYDYDLDTSAFLLGADGKTACDDDFVFYNNSMDPSGSVRLLGDDRVGNNGETIIVDFSRIPDSVQKVAIAVTINEAEKRKQNFGKVSNAVVRVMRAQDENDDNGETVLMFDLQNEQANDSAMIVCEIVREVGRWRFNALAEGVPTGLEGICGLYGIDVE